MVATVLWEGHRQVVVSVDEMGSLNREAAVIPV
jgi:hypothetical protein